MSQDSQGDREVQGSYLAWFAGAAMIATVALVIGVVALFLPTGGGDGGSGGGGGGGTGGGGGGDVAAGQEAFNASCASCHGKDGLNPTVGKDLIASTFVTDTSDADLVTFIETGRGTDDPANTTGVAMPAKGGNPSLSAEDLQGIVAYLKSLQG
jgi:disulfide bond formation protein DsbB